MSTTASDPVWGKSNITKILVDEWDYLTKPMSTNMHDYEIRRFGYKDYGVYLAGLVLKARYKCSHLEARRRWAMVIVTKRLCS